MIWNKPTFCLAMALVLLASYFMRSLLWPESKSALQWSFLLYFDDYFNFFEHKAVYEGVNSAGGAIAVAKLLGINVFEPVGNIIKAYLLLAVNGYENARSLRICSLGFHFVNAILLFVYAQILILPAEFARPKATNLSAIDASVFMNDTNRCIDRKYNRSLILCVIAVYSLLFFVHPINIQVVAWLSSAQYSMSLMFSLLSSISLEVFFANHHPDSHFTSAPFILHSSSVVFFVLAVFSKAPAVTVAVIHMFRIMAKFRYQFKSIQLATLLLIWLVAFVACYYVISSANGESNNADFEFDLVSILPYGNQISTNNNVYHQVVEAWHVISCILVRAVIIIRDFTVRVMFPTDLRIHYMAKDIGHYSIFHRESILCGSNVASSNEACSVDAYPRYSHVDSGSADPSLVQSYTISIIVFVAICIFKVFIPIIEDFSRTKDDILTYSGNLSPKETTTSNRPNWLLPKQILVETTGLLSYIVLFLPGLNLVNHGWVQLGADRYVYFPLAYAAPAAALVTYKAIIKGSDYVEYCIPNSKDSISNHEKKGSRIIYAKLFVVVLSFLFLLVPLSQIADHQLVSYSSDERILKNCIKIDPTDWECASYLSQYYFENTNNTDLGELYREMGLLNIDVKSASIKNSFFKSAQILNKYGVSTEVAAKVNPACDVVRSVYDTKIKPFINVLRTDIIFMGLNNYAVCHVITNGLSVGSIFSLLTELSSLIERADNCRLNSRVVFFNSSGFFDLDASTCENCHCRFAKIDEKPAILSLAISTNKADLAVGCFNTNVDLLIRIAEAKLAGNRTRIPDYTQSFIF